MQEGEVNSAVMFSKASDEWATPAALFDALEREFAFVIDAAAKVTTSKCGVWYFGPDYPIAGLRDALQIDWHGMTALHAGVAIWLNPPYSKCRHFIAKAASEAQKGCTVVCLVPSRTDTRWWHEHVWDSERHACRPGVEVRFIKGRLKFGNSENSAPFPSVIVIFRPAEHVS